ncbi:MAG: hypothetical protein PSV36_10345 [Algoriphagus sp.]|nr:hypothetical protein [Algoriphagus sp.]
MIFPLEAKLPWINHFAFGRLKTLIRPDFRVLEFGSGGSTLFFKDHTAYVYSIEHDAKWFENVKSKCQDTDKVELNLLQPEIDPEAQVEYKSINGMFTKGLSYKKYSHGADHLPDESFDLLLIDGRARPKCLKNSISKLKPGGILVFDNSDRESYQPVISTLLKGWKSEVYQGVTIYDAFFNQTTLFFKPA